MALLGVFLAGFFRPGLAIDLPALPLNVVLLLLFGLQHSLMARRPCKEWLTQFIPEQLERSTYILSSGLALILLVLCWQPMPGYLWRVEAIWAQALIWLAFGLGLGILWWSSGRTGLSDLLGLRQARLHREGRPYEPLPLVTTGLYKYIRHPLMTGTILILWAGPEMSYDRALIALGFTLYIFIGVYFEERSLEKVYGEKYRKYKESTTAFIPGII